MPPVPTSDLVETIRLSGFDPAGEPEVRRFADGSLQVVFSFMPPSFVKDEGGWVDLGRYWKLDEEMARAVGVEVVWEDREYFHIEHPREDTIQRLREFLARYHAEQG
jgi:hypothetical protein